MTPRTGQRKVRQKPTSDHEWTFLWVDPFSTDTASPPRNVYRYCGERFDPDLGLGHNRARYLNPNTGRFWTMDVYEGQPEKPLSLHKYLYAADDPVNQLDPSGKFTLTESESVVATGITLDITPLVAVGALYAAYVVDEKIEQVAAAREIDNFVTTHSGSRLTQNEFDDLEDEVKVSLKRKNRKLLYLHYSFVNAAPSLVGTGLWEQSWATRDVYPTGWSAKWNLALLQVEIQDAVYVIMPKYGFAPVGPRVAQDKIDKAYRHLDGGGNEWRFPFGSGGSGTVFGPIPIPIGTKP